MEIPRTYALSCLDSLDRDPTLSSIDQLLNKLKIETNPS